MAVELLKNQDTSQFLLWVFATNSSAIKLYKRMKFVATREEHYGIRSEIKYRLYVSPRIRAEVCQTASSARLEDNQIYGVTYRVLG